MQPKVYHEVTVAGRTRRWTGWRALAVAYGPVAMFAFMLGVLVGTLLALIGGAW
jgi:hypothetical protein